jgi:hypothetical protein
MSVYSGDRLDVVLDVYVEEGAYRVVLVGVYRPDRSKPAPQPGATRNVVQSWLERDHHARVFQLAIGTTQHE